MSSKGKFTINSIIVIICLVLVTSIIFVWRVPIKTFFSDLLTEETPETVDVRINNIQHPITNIQQSTTNELESAISDQAAKPEAEELEPDTQEEELPEEYNLKVPFVRQAPFDDWSMPFKEGCEEASILAVHYWYQGLDSVSQQKMKDDIIAAVDWQLDYFGSHKDLTAAETVELIQEYYGYQNVELEYDVSLEDIKQAVYSGYPVIVPAAGREMGNVNFQTPGPLYHMTVIKGWTKNGSIITNDPGTRRGADYIYNPDKLYNSIHDWNNGDVNNGRKAMIVIK